MPYSLLMGPLVHLRNKNNSKKIFSPRARDPGGTVLHQCSVLVDLEQCFDSLSTRRTYLMCTEYKVLNCAEHPGIFGCKGHWGTVCTL